MQIKTALATLRLWLILFMENKYWCSIAVTSAIIVRAELVPLGGGKFKVVDDETGTGELKDRIIDASDILYCETQLEASTQQDTKHKYFERFCREILNTSESIRFVGIANPIGLLAAAVYRQGVIPLMTKQEFSQYSIRAAIREDFASKIGMMKYLIGKYEKLIRVIVPIAVVINNNTSSEIGRESRRFYLVLSFDVNADVEPIIKNKVLPLIEENKEHFV
jgi:hypothetical protein